MIMFSWSDFWPGRYISVLIILTFIRVHPYCVCVCVCLSPHLSLLIEGHDHHSSSVALHSGSSKQELLLSFLQTDTVDNTLPLTALQPSLNHWEVRGVDTQRNLGRRGRDFLIYWAGSFVGCVCVAFKPPTATQQCYNLSNLSAIWLFHSNVTVAETERSKLA